MSLRRVLVLLAVVGGIALSAVTAQRAWAGWASCRSDPVVVLSNGMVLDLSAGISTFPWNVERVDYVLHVPEGVGLVASVATPAWLTSKETFTFYADGAPGEYHTETTVYTNQSNTAVSAETILLSALGVQLDLSSVPGTAGQTLHTYLTAP